MNEGLPPEILIVREERGRGEAMENRNQVAVARAVSGEFAPDFARANFPGRQNRLLFETEVFIEDQHGSA